MYSNSVVRSTFEDYGNVRKEEREQGLGCERNYSMIKFNKSFPTAATKTIYIRSMYTQP
jgi:hypothetical protein